MNLKTYQAKNMAEALAQVKRDLGSEAVILHTRTFRRGGLLGIGAKNVVEVTAAKDVQLKPRKRKPRPQATGESSEPTARPAGLTPAAEGLLRKAYAQAGDRGAVTPSPMPKAQPAPMPVPSSAGDSQLAAELKQIRALVQRMARQNPQSKQADMPDVLFQKYLALLEQEVAEELADEIVQGMREKLGNGDLEEAEIKRALGDEIGGLLPEPGQGFDFTRQRPTDGRPFTLALIGPTGVGKTTTVAKLAATFKLRDRLNVALLTIDTYRIAAVDQLRTYADIIGVPLMVANTPMETRQALERLQGYDVVIIDTAGRSQRDDDKLDQLKSFIDAADPHEVHLVLSVTSRQEVMLEIADRFSRIRTDKLIFTKLDEAVNFGVVLNVIRRVNKQLSYITTGQEVPHHIEVGRPSRLAGLIVEGKLQ